jgi:hypothetical protein
VETAVRCGRLRCAVRHVRFCLYRLPLPVLIPKQLGLGFNKTNQKPII